jgi:hypothetical protein
MVVESDRAGAQVTCPNCRRTLKVPSGKDRGVEIAAAPAASLTRTSRLCQRCGKEVPVDSQMCPHCKAILLDGPPGQAAPAAAAATGAAVAGRGPKLTRTAASAAAGTAGTQVIYGGARGGWWAHLSPGAKAGVLAGAFAFVFLVVIIGFFMYRSWYAGELSAARQGAQDALTQGRKLENIGKFQEAYESYYYVLIREKYLRDSGDPKDAQAADALKARILALQYLVAEPKVRTGESVYWKPRNQQEYDQAVAAIKQSYPEYRQWLSAVCDAGLAAVQTAKANPGLAAFDEKVGQTMDAYVKLVGRTTDQQRAQRTFQQMKSGIMHLTAAERNWDKVAQRDNYLKITEQYLLAAKEFSARGDDGLESR